jgi:hypothetical protein
VQAALAKNLLCRSHASTREVRTLLIREQSWQGENACFNELGLNAHSDLPRRIPADVIQETGQAAIVVDIPDYDGRVKNARPDIIERS